MIAKDHLNSLEKNEAFKLFLKISTFRTAAHKDSQALMDSHP